MRLLRLFKILSVAFHYGLDEFVFMSARLRGLRGVSRSVFFWRPLRLPRAVRLRLALEKLGPIFVKFGQVLSTRRDLLPPDIADELAKLQDRVPPFPAELVVAALQRVYGQPYTTVFAEFDLVPVASASVAQVHFARLFDGTEVAVKILRPNIRGVIAEDVALMENAARFLERFSAEARRLRPREVVLEFAKHLGYEQDLMREAANASQLRRNFLDGRLLLVPEVYWDYCRREIMVMQRMHGIPISQVALLRAQGVDLSKLSRDGVEIFFTQVFRDGFFHADMHPGNIAVAPDGRYIGLDFGIMGTLTDADKNYLAQNFLAFFRRDYKRVATAHIEAGWAPPDTREDEFEAAIRAVCEPIFDKPLKEISFGKVLLRLFETSREFNVRVQPQLALLQKTLLNVEGLGRELDPDLDLWKTAKPYLERWMKEQIGWRGVWHGIREEAPHWATMLPRLPRLMHHALARKPEEAVQHAINQVEHQLARQNAWLIVVVSLLGVLGVILIMKL